ncbi:MAG TPA: hypothetical protein ENI72_03205, partial [Rhodospirillales bacterium]|nr:hypothetical protein [Rhodospirillales bacterium]
MAEEFGGGAENAQDSEDQQILDDLTVLGNSANADLSAVQQVGGVGPDGLAVDDPNVLSTVHQGSRMTADEVLANLVDEGGAVSEDTVVQPEASQTAPLDQADIPAPASIVNAPVDGQAASGALEGAA